MDGSFTSLLIVDDSATDRAALKTAVGNSVSVVYEASTPKEAWALASNLNSLTLLVAGIPEAEGHTVFDLRDQIAAKFGQIPAAFCSRSDMSAFYSMVGRHEMLFYKPIDRNVMTNWITDVTKTGATESMPETGDTLAISPSQPAQTQAAAETTSPAPDQSAPVETQAPVQEAPAHSLPEGELPLGTVLGDYKLKEVIQTDGNFGLYEAVQTSIQRDVAVKLLFRKHRKDPVWVGAFVEEARARALINHPSISLVYEAAQEFGVNFYTLELIDAPSLIDLANRREMLDDDALWNLLESIADALCYLKANKMRHRLITGQTIFLVNNDQVRIANPVKGAGAMISVEEEEKQMKLVGEAIRPFLRQGKTDAGIFTIYERLTHDRIDTIKTAEGLKDALNTTESAPAVSSAEKARIEEEHSNKTAIIVGGLVGGLIVIGSIIGMLTMGKESVARDFSIFNKVPAGVAVYQKDKQVELDDYWMEQHEVTIAQYAEFLADLAANPAKVDEVKHPQQPTSKTSFAPKDWDEMYAKAKKAGKFLGVRIDLNCPVLNVDWWDAYAFARWKGGRLPTEQEWEKAARSRTGNLYPWGADLDLTLFNSGVDTEATGEGEEKKGPGGIDGHKYWAAVDAHPGDESRYGVRNMAGNVTEWTASWDTHPDKPDAKVPLRRGASFNTKEGFELTARRSTEGPTDTNLWTGFRIVRDASPDDVDAPIPPHQELPVGAIGTEKASDSAPPADTAPAPAPADDADKPAGENPGTGDGTMKDGDGTMKEGAMAPEPASVEPETGETANE